MISSALPLANSSILVIEDGLRIQVSVCTEVCVESHRQRRPRRVDQGLDVVPIDPLHKLARKRARTSSPSASTAVVGFAD